MQTVDAQPDSRFKILSLSDLLSLPEPQWLIEKMFTLGALVGVYGPSGSGKSFLALSWALAIAAGLDWGGHRVRQGSVIYVAAEGGRSIRKRVEAWTIHHRLKDIPGAFFLLESVQLRSSSDVETLLHRIRELGIKPTLIILDTLAKCFGDGDENTAKEMGQFVTGMDNLQHETGASVLVVHHTGKKDTGVERGSSALRAAIDTMVGVAVNGSGVITVTNDKQKDDEEFADIKLRLAKVITSGQAEPEITSCVVVPAHDSADESDALSSPLKNTLSALQAQPEGMAGSKTWEKASGLKNRTFHSHREKLNQTGYVEEVRAGVYRATEKGKTPETATARGLQTRLH